jgi:ATP-dependent RNA helicase DDX58
MMTKAIDQLQTSIEHDRNGFLNALEEMQRRAKAEKELKLQAKWDMKATEGEFELRCIHCRAFGFMSSDVRKIQNAHHVVVDPSFRERANTSRRRKANFKDSQIEMAVSIVTCKPCGQPYGNISLYLGVPLPIVKIENFLIVDSHDRKYPPCKKWNKAPFNVEALATEELQTLSSSSNWWDV